MSVFGFINKKENSQSFSSGLSSLLIEDLYDSQIDTFVNQPKPTKTSSKSYFSMIDDFAMTTNSASHHHQSKSKSNQADTQATQAETKSIFSFMSPTSSTVSLPVRHKIKPNNEMKLISATSSLRRVQAEKNIVLKKIQGLYNKQNQIRDQIKLLKSRIQSVELEKEKALKLEDFLKVEEYRNQKEQMTNSLYELSLSQTLQYQLHSACKEMHALITNETEIAKHVLDCCEKVKHERHLQYMKFVTDNERMHQKRLKEIEEGRLVIETEKSEIAFEYGLWEQSNQDLIERKQDAIYQLDLEKKKMNAEANLVQIEINDLKLKLNMLQSRKESLLDSVTKIDIVMHEKLEPFSLETQEHEEEYQHLDAKRSEITEKEHVLDEQETLIDEDINKYSKDKDSGLNELQTLDEHMAEALELGQQTETIESLNQFIQLVESRDQIIKGHQTELQVSKETIQESSKKMKTMQESLFGKQQESIQLDESISELEHKVKNWERHKQLAIDTGRFQNAAAWKDQIKAAQKELYALKSQIQSVPNNQIYEEEQEKLALMIQQEEALKIEKNAEIRLILERSLDELSYFKLPWIQQEIKSIQAQLQQE